ncbi:unnamed protein product [Paramecium sonneborni]|uniref:Uncharacterized protein n=1 Tax=Paramecium sonneborni TaxID=65129 RepID=A0A8S1R013_9CILI|nr:unnamed protein product [Paramecium sonneborni]
MLEYINRCLEFSLSPAPNFQTPLLTNVKHLANLENYCIHSIVNLNPSITYEQSPLVQHSSISESYVIQENKLNNFTQESPQQSSNKKNLNLIFNQQGNQSTKTLREQIDERLQNRQRQSHVPECAKFSFSPFKIRSKSPLIQQQRPSPEKLEEYENKENQMPTIHKKQFSQINQYSETPKKVYIPFQNTKFNKTPSKQSQIQNKIKSQVQPSQQQRHSLKREYKNGVSHIKLTLYKQ